MIKIIVIEDESLARDIIRKYLEELDGFEIIAECANGFEGLKAIQELKPDIVFLDIQMPKINGFEMLELLDDVPQIIFSTAFDQYAIKAFESNAADYLLKPYTKERFVQAVQRARQRLTEENPLTQNIKKIADDSTHEPLSRIVVRNGARIEIIDTRTIEYFQATDDYVEIHCSQGKFLKQMTMKYLDVHLDENRFVRAHRSYIIAIDHLSKIEHYEKDTHLAMMKSGEKLPISRSGYGRLREVLNF